MSELQLPLRFDGRTLGPGDEDRLTGQALRVWRVMRDGEWRSLADIKIACGGHDSEAAISARLRDFRKPRFGGHVVERKHLGNGLWVYRVNDQEVNDVRSTR